MRDGRVVLTDCVIAAPEYLPRLWLEGGGGCSERFVARYIALTSTSLVPGQSRVVASVPPRAANNRSTVHVVQLGCVPACARFDCRAVRRCCD